MDKFVAYLLLFGPVMLIAIPFFMYFATPVTTTITIGGNGTGNFSVNASNTQILFMNGTDVVGDAGLTYTPTTFSAQSNSIDLGFGANCGGLANSVCVGSNAVGTETECSLLGQGAQCYGTGGTAMGALATILAPQCNAFGGGAVCYSDRCTTLGYGAICSNPDEITIGAGITISNESDTTINSRLFVAGNATINGNLTLPTPGAFMSVGTTPTSTYVGHFKTTTQGANLVVEDGRNLTSRAQFRLVGNNLNNSQDYFLFSFRSDIPDVVMSVYDNSSATFYQFLQYRYLAGNTVYFGNPSVMSVNYTSGNIAIGKPYSTVGSASPYNLFVERDIRVNTTASIYGTGGAYSAEFGNTTSDSATFFEADGTLFMNKDATTFNIAQAQLDHAWGDQEPFVWSDKYWGYELPNEASAYASIVAPRDVINNTAFVARMHFINPEACQRSFSLHTQIANRCENGGEHEHSTYEYCDENDAGQHCIVYAGVDNPISGDTLVQMKWTRGTDECEQAPVIAVADILYEQDTIGSRTEWDK